ncbi:MAG TPA: hypothetical protein PLH87_13035 [Bacillota bacterium]|nr:hypothetical protein [Bacillota bacterium]
MQIVSELTDKPREFHDLCQNQKFYIGNDEIKEIEYPKGTIIVALAGPEPEHIGYYFTNIEALIKSNFDSNSLCQGVQVHPYYDPRYTKTPQYKTDARFYVLNEPVKVAVGEVTNNFHYGKGGLLQYAIPNSKDMILNNLKDSYKYNPDHTIIPVNLNDFELDPRLTTETKKELDVVREKAIQAGCLISGNGSIKLNNIEISKHAYLVIKFREKLHESFVRINCLKKEYVDELTKKSNERNLDKIKEVKDQLDWAYSSSNCAYRNFENLKQGLDVSIHLQGFNKENQEYLLDATTSIPPTTREIGRYLDERINYLERSLSTHERDYLGLNPNGKSAEFIDPKNPQDEARVQQYYQKYAIFEPNYLNRKLVFPPKESRYKVTEAKRRLLSQFKTKEDLQQFLGNLKVRKQEGIVYRRKYSEYSALKKEIEATAKEIDSLSGNIPKFKTGYEKDLYLIERDERGKILKQTLIFQLKSRERLQELMEKKPEDKLITAYCGQQIKELDRQIEKNTSELALYPTKIPKYDEALQYLLQKAEQAKTGINPSKDPVKERQTERLYQEISGDFVNQEKKLSIYEWNENEMKPAFEAKRFYEITLKLDKQNEMLSKIKKLETYNNSLNERTNKLRMVKSDLEFIDQYQAKQEKGIISKIFTKKDEAQQYEQVKQRLDKAGITSWKQYYEAHESLKTEKGRFLEKYKEIEPLVPNKYDLSRSIRNLSEKRNKILQEKVTSNDMRTNFEMAR